MLHIPETGFISKLIFLIVTFLQEPLWDRYGATVPVPMAQFTLDIAISSGVIGNSLCHTPVAR